MIKCLSINLNKPCLLCTKCYNAEVVQPYHRTSNKRIQNRLNYEVIKKFIKIKNFKTNNTYMP